jgi:hypothetical protein
MATAKTGTPSDLSEAERALRNALFLGYQLKL